MKGGGGLDSSDNMKCAVSIYSNPCMVNLFGATSANGRLFLADWTAINNKVMQKMLAMSYPVCQKCHRVLGSDIMADGVGVGAGFETGLEVGLGQGW